MEDPPRKGQWSCSSVTLRTGVVCPEVKMTGDTVVTTLDRVRTPGQVIITLRDTTVQPPSLVELAAWLHCELVIPLGERYFQLH